MQVGGERGQLIDDLAELKQRQAVDGTQDGMGKAARRFQLQLLIAARAQAGVDGDHDGQRQLRLAMEDRDLLRLAVLEDLEVFLLQAGTGAPLLSVTVVNTFTSFTFTLKVALGSSLWPESVGCCCWALSGG